MKIKMINKIIIVCATVLFISSCAKKLDLYPVNNPPAIQVYSTPEGYKSVLAKIYGTLTVTGNAGPAGDPDIAGGLDEGSQVAFIRMFFNCQELPTDEAVVAWNDQTIQDFHSLKWTSSDPFIKGMYARPIYNITLINEYIRESAPAILASRGIRGAAAEDILNSNAEARFLRAFNYWVMLDIFGKSTFITEKDKIEPFFTPREISRPELYKYIVDELKAIENSLAPARTIEYGRVDQAAAWALLARIYLNAKVYTGTEQYTEALTYAKKVIDAGYSLHPNYAELFLADNDKCKDEFIFTINCDGLRSQAYGNTTFFVHAAAGDDNKDFGVDGGWFGYRATRGLADKFFDLTGKTDKRALFTTSKYKPTQAQIEIAKIADFNNGLHVCKYRNVRSDDKPVSDQTLKFSDVDFPVFRLAEMYLIYAEATARGGAGDIDLAVTYINNLRKRAYGNDEGNVVAANIKPEFVLDERARELYWEGHRRTDLIRFGLLTTASYLWPWKGGVASGTAVDDKYNLFPIPVSNINSNPNLTQNTGF